MKNNNKTIEIITPHGFCGGVSHALKVAKEAIENPNTKKPIYLLGNLIHNKIVTESLTKSGVTTIDIKGKSRYELLDYIESGTVIFSAHGVSDKVREKALSKGLNIIDASCGKVLLIHKRVKDYIKQGYQILYIGKLGHPEAESILEEDSSIKLIQNVNDIPTNLSNKLIYVTNQTTLSIIETKDIYDKIKELYPNSLLDNNICHATTERQLAVSNLVGIDLCIVVGDKLSSNSRSLVEIAQNKTNVSSVLVETCEDITKELLGPYNHIAITSSASCPEEVFLEIIEKVKEIISL